jgi:cytochrome oxidase Cu insertion factor (SCO1/SenC/PrrC family)
MKNLLFLMLLSLIVSSCNRQSKEDKMKEFIAANKADVDFDIGSTPKNFSVKTTDGTTFNSKVNKGKYWVVFVYSHKYLTKTDDYDMVAELNETYKKFGDKLPMIGIAEGLSEDEKETKKLFEGAKLQFKQIDNTEGIEKEEKIKDNVVCTPAKILIGPDGKVMINTCGGKNNALDVELERLIKEGKL